MGSGRKDERQYVVAIALRTGKVVEVWDDGNYRRHDTLRIFQYKIEGADSREQAIEQAEALFVKDIAMCKRLGFDLQTGLTVAKAG